jgi:hypothetical protein
MIIRNAEIHCYMIESLIRAAMSDSSLQHRRKKQKLACEYIQHFISRICIFRRGVDAAA